VTNVDLKGIYLDFLSKEGYRPRINEDGDIDFKHEGTEYTVEIIEDDSQYFRLCCAIWPIEGAEERTKGQVFRNLSFNLI
jgi:hypothetical protein